MTKNVRVHTFMDYFKSKFIPRYVKYFQHARWLDNESHQCKTTFSYGTILSIIQSIENYSLTPQE